MVKQFLLFAVLVSILGIPRSVLAQHDHGSSQPDAGASASSSNICIEHTEQIQKLTARLAEINEALQGTENPRELQQGVEEQGRLLAELKSLVTEHHALMAEQKEAPTPSKSKKKGCGHRSYSVHH